MALDVNIKWGRCFRMLICIQCLNILTLSTENINYNINYNWLTLKSDEIFIRFYVISQIDDFSITTVKCRYETKKKSQGSVGQN